MPARNGCSTRSTPTRSTCCREGERRPRMRSGRRRTVRRAIRRSGRPRPQSYREHFYDEVIGRFDQPLLPAESAHAAGLRRAEVHRLRSGARRAFPTCSPTAFCCCPRTCSRASGGRSSSASTAWKAGRRTWPIRTSPIAAYNQFACRLAERGFIAFAPQNPYIFQDRFRTLQRKANPLGKTLFSIIVPQHQQIVDWLAHACRRSIPSGSPSTACPTAARRRCACRRW